jgi:DNA-binding MarR family transcriptional regulator
MTARTPPRLPPALPPSVMEAIRKRLSRREMQAMETVFALRSTAQQMDNAITEWFAGTAGSPARFQILTMLWAAGGNAVPHKDIVAAMGVTRATVSGLMTALEREGLVRSSVDHDDRRRLHANLTPKGEAVIGKAQEANRTRFRPVAASLSPAELATLRALLQRFREGFAASGDATKRR